MKTKVIDLGNYRSPESRVFSGQDRGKTVRSKLNIERLENEYDVIEIKIPEDTISINTSFFLGFLAKSVKTFGELRFRGKYLFVCSPIITQDIDIGIERAIKISSIFS